MKETHIDKWCEFFGEALDKGDIGLGKKILEKLESIFPDDNNWKDQCLFACVFFNTIDFINYLIELGANPNTKSYFTALDFACIQENLEIIKMLVECGADVNLKSDNNGQPLRTAHEKKNSAIMSYLIKHGAKIDNSEEILDFNKETTPF